MTPAAQSPELFSTALERTSPLAVRHGAGRFVGSKGGAGIAQWLISLMPPHRVYVEAFLGRGVIMRTKLKGVVNIGIEIDAQTLANYPHAPNDQIELHHADALLMLPTLRLTNCDLVYCDPPYPASVRADGPRKYYASGRAAKPADETHSEEWHAKFLKMVKALPCMVIVSGYECEQYNAALDKWRTSYKWTVNRAGSRVKEFVWMNFDAPALLHDPRFVGGNYTDRQRVKRKIARWQKNFRAMPADERWAVYEALTNVVDTTEQPGFVYEH